MIYERLAERDIWKPVSERPVLLRGSAGAWDSYGVMHTCLLPGHDGYRLWYEGRSKKEGKVDGHIVFGSEIGYADRCIYNSISLGMTDREEEALAHSEIDSAILLAYNPADSSVEGTIKALEKGGAGRGAGLIDLARVLGMTDLLIDPGVVPLGDGAGRSIRATLLAKAKFGLPTGSGIHNAVSSWRWLRSKERGVRDACDAASAGLEILAGGNFVLYGPIERAEEVFPVAAMTDILVSEAVKDLEVWPAAGHPIGRLI